MSSTASSARRRCSRDNRPARPAPIFVPPARDRCPGAWHRRATRLGPPRVLAHEPGQSPAPSSAPHAARGEAELGLDDTDGTAPAPNGPAPAPQCERTRPNRRHLSSCTDEPGPCAVKPGIDGSIPAPAIPSPPWARPLWHRHARSPVPSRASPAAAGKSGACATVAGQTVHASNGPDPAKRYQCAQACQPQERPPAVNQPMHDLDGHAFGRSASARTNPGPLTGTRWLERTRMPVPTASSPGPAGWALPHAAGADGLPLAPNEPDPASRPARTSQWLQHSCTNEPKRGVDGPSIGWKASAQTNPGLRSAMQFLHEQMHAFARLTSPSSVAGATLGNADADGRVLATNGSGPTTRHEQALQWLQHSCTNEPKRDVEAPAIGRSGSARTSPCPPVVVHFLQGRTYLSGRRPSRGSAGGTTRRATGADDRVFAPNGPKPGATTSTNVIPPATQACLWQEQSCTNEPERDVDAPAHHQERCRPAKPGPAAGDTLLARTNPRAGLPPVIPGLDQRLMPGPPPADRAVLVPTGAGPVKPSEPLRARKRQGNRRTNERRGGIAGPSAVRSIPVRTNPGPPSAQLPPCKRAGAHASFRSPSGPEGPSDVALPPIEPDRARRHKGTQADQRLAHPRTSEPTCGVGGAVADRTAPTRTNPIRSAHAADGRLRNVAKRLSRAGADPNDLQAWRSRLSMIACRTFPEPEWLDGQASPETRLGWGHGQDHRRGREQAPAGRPSHGQRPATAGEHQSGRRGGTGGPSVMGASGGYQQAAPHALVAKVTLAAPVDPKRARGFTRAKGITGTTGRIDAEVIESLGTSRMPAPTPTPNPARAALTEILACRRRFPAPAGVQGPTIRARAHQVIAFLRTEPTGPDEPCLRRVQADAALAAGYRLLPAIPRSSKILAEMPRLGRTYRRPVVSLAGRGRRVVRDIGGLASRKTKDATFARRHAVLTARQAAQARRHRLDA